MLFESALIIALGCMIWRGWFAPKSTPDSGASGEPSIENERFTRFARGQVAEETPAAKPINLDSPTESFLVESTVEPPETTPQERPSAHFLGTVVDLGGNGVPGEVMIFSPDGRFSIAAQNGVFAGVVDVGTFAVIAQYRDGSVLRVTDPLSITFEADEKIRHDFILPISPPVGTLGIELALKADYAVVTAVTPGSQAASLGLQVGDAIASLNGTPINHLSAEEIQGIVVGSPDVAVRVVIVVETTQGFEEVAVELTRQVP